MCLFNCENDKNYKFCSFFFIILAYCYHFIFRIHKIVFFFSKVAGLGKLKPNIVITGFKRNWAERGIDGLSEINDYFGVIQ